MASLQSLQKLMRHIKHRKRLKAHNMRGTQTNVYMLEFRSVQYRCIISLCVHLSSGLDRGHHHPPPTRHAACSEHQTAMYTMSWEVSYEHKRVGHEWVAESVICHLYHSVNQREQLKILYIYLKTYLHITFYKYLKNLHNSITILKWRTKITI